MKELRKNHFIDKDFQGKFILKFSLIVLISSVVICWLIWLFTKDSTTVVIQNTKVSVKSTGDFIFPIMFITAFIVSAVSSLVAIMLTMYVSHKISGPIYRLQKDLIELKSGNLKQQFNIRADDQLQELANTLRATASIYRENQSTISKNFLELKINFEKAENQLPTEIRDAVKVSLKEIESALKFYIVE